MLTRNACSSARLHISDHCVWLCVSHTMSTYKAKCFSALKNNSTVRVDAAGARIFFPAPRKMVYCFNKAIGREQMP